MFMERNQARREEPIYGREVFGFAPKGASRSQFGLVFYKHFAATRFPWQPHGRRLVEIIDLEFAGTKPGPDKKQHFILMTSLEHYVGQTLDDKYRLERLL